MDKRKTLPHHDARHGTVEMVDASDEDESSLTFNSGGAVASSASSFLVVTSLGLGNDLS
jgi:hypothetical protein